ncbi:DUF3263 domain-containing protein [Rhodococcus opacus]|uniref:DUF3263 domain-containing protein n=1 Tax=Rhodococcus opacus TaxID=37919 RepID=UPI00223612F7|nr:DUF3263 domain-containing protein [Rhodococcus opacus]MDV6247388.1 DUF3263 domain-containing protein [Rhodococcus opacus]UZG60037.1 DUF3263 domain-containing protein [Rhodococcus opacus]
MTRRQLGTATAVSDPLTPQERRVLEFARTWAPFGEPPDGEIFVEFGVDPTRFYRDLMRILSTHCPSCLLAPAERAQVLQLANNHT